MQANPTELDVDPAERLALIQQAWGVGVFTIDVRSHQVTWDAAMRTLFDADGNAPANLAQWSALLFEESRQAFREAVQRCSETRAPFEIEVQLRSQTGVARTLCCIGRPRSPGSHTIIGSCRDISLRISALERFAEAERLGGVGSWSFDLRTGEIEWSDMLYHFMGHPPEAGAPDFDTAMHDYDDESEAMLRQLVHRAITEGAPYGQLLRTRHGHHGVRYLFARGNVRRDRSGQIVGMFGTVTDVTKQTEYEQSIAHIASAMPGALYQYVTYPDGSHEVPYISDGVIQLYGLTPEQVMEDPNTMFACIDEADLPAVQASIMEAARTLTQWSQTFRVFSRDGVTRHIRAISMPVAIPDGSLHWYGFSSDVSDRVAFETELREARQQAELANQAKTNFLANMSHEIRTPMTAILGYLAVVEGSLEEASAEIDLPNILHTVRMNAQHLLQILNDILDVSKIEVGKMTIETLPIEPLTIVDDVIKLNRPNAADKGLALELSWSSDIPHAVATDPTRFRQILQNLVNNAIKFTQTGSVTLSADYDRASEELRIEVADTGVGMSEAQVERIRKFDPFHQADDSTTRRYGGTGLGLCISHLLANLLGGALTIESEEGIGSAITMSVHASPANLTPPSRPAPEASTKALPLEGTRILVAEDGQDNQRLISFVLRRAGATVEVVENGRLAVDAMNERSSFDLVLMDMAMPELDGYGATRALRGRGVQTPVVALTAHAMSEDRQRCIAVGCNDYLSKPFQPKDLIEIAFRWTQSSLSQSGSS